MFKSIETQHRDLNALDWDAAIDLNRAALIRLLTVMVAALGMEVGGSVERVPLRVRLMVMRVRIAVLPPNPKRRNRCPMIWWTQKPCAAV